MPAPDTYAEKWTCNGKYPGDRKDGTAKQGLTAIPVQIIYDAELYDPSCLASCLMACCCATLDKRRSYLYLRNGSIESNDANRDKCVCTPDACLRLCVPLTDDTKVQYFDRAPYKAHGSCGNRCCVKVPKVEIMKGGCMCCFQHCQGCASCGCRDMVVLMPYEVCAPPLCCCTNRVCWFHNYCGLCGPVTGNPLYASMFEHPQPKNVQAFVDIAQKQLTKEWTPAEQTMDRLGA